MQPEQEEKIFHELRAVKDSVNRLEKAVTGDPNFGHKGVIIRVASLEERADEHDKVLNRFPEISIAEIKTDIHQVKLRLWWVIGIICATGALLGYILEII